MTHRAARIIIIMLLLFTGRQLPAQKVPDTLAVEALIDKAMAVEVNNPDSSFLLAEQAYRLAQKTDYQRGMSWAFMRFASVLKLKGKSDSSLIYLRLALAIRKKLNDDNGQAGCYRYMSFLFREKDNKDSAFYYLYKALRLYEKNSNSAGIGNVSNELGELSFNYGDRKKALLHLNEALHIFTRLNDAANLAVTYSQFGIVFYYERDYPKALSYFLRSKVLDDSLQNTTFLAKDWNYLGLCYDALKKDKLARACYNEALLLFTALNLQEGKAEVLFNTGVYFQNRLVIDSAVYYYEKSDAALKGTGAGLTLKVYQALSEVYAVKGNYLQAYTYHFKYAQLNDSLLNREKIKQVAEMQTRYDTDKKNQEIEMLGQQNKAKALQRNGLIAGSVALLLLISLLGYFFIQRGRSARQNEALSREKISGLLKEQEISSYNAMIEGQEDERKRIATDLHDRLGSMLSTVKLLFSALDEKIDKNQGENQAQYNKATSLLDEACLEVRRISHNLSTGMVITFGLVPALEELCESIDNSRLIKCRLLCYGMEARLEQQTEIGLFRMIQEMVNNVLKHANAKQLTIQLNHTADSINLTVEDDGVGFDVTTKMKSGGMGLKNLEARAAKLNGVFYTDSKPGRGTISIIEIPLSNDTHPDS